MKLPYGQANFATIRTEGYYYVDKTRYLEVLEGLPERHVVILRSRRFGKTLFVNMLGYYYDQLCAGQFETLFDGTYIHAHPTPKRNAYMLLTFNFSGINTETLENANEGFAFNVRSELDVFLGRYQQHFSRADYDFVMAGQKPNDLLTGLFNCLKRKGLGKCVYVTIDEYDHFANNLLSQGKEMFKKLVQTDGYVRPFYEALKKGTETVIDRIFITGVLPILLDSLTSGFNVAKNKSTDARFNEMFGFTEPEIQPILDDLGHQEGFAELRTYYNGYCFSPEASQTLYNSDMILFYGTEYVPELKKARNMIDTNVVSDYRKIRAILAIGERAVEEAILTRIVRQRQVTIKAIAQLFILTAETEFRFDEETLISLLFYMGYLTIRPQPGFGVTLSMPNLVLESLYLDYMEHLLMSRASVQIRDREKFEMWQDLLAGKIDRLLALAEKLLKGLSNRDYEQFDEKYIKVVLLSLLSDVNIYIPHSEYEVSADGYVDLYLQAAFQPAQSAHYFFELKYAKAKATPAVLARKENEGVRAMQMYARSPAAQAIPHLQAYVLVFRKDRCVRKVLCS